MSHSQGERRPESRWSLEEDKILLSAIEQCGSVIVWNQVSACLPGRNSKSCRKRWIHSLDPTLRKGRWTEDEDALLTTAVEAYGTHWFQVEKMLPRRTDDQCAKRWRENLDPSISRKPWTEEDDKLLMETYEKIGKRWKEIASHFEGRPPVHCRNRLQSLIRVRCRAAAGKAVQAKVKGRKSITRKKVTPTESTLAPLDFSGGETLYLLEQDFASYRTPGDPLPPTPISNTSELCQDIQEPQYSLSVPTHSLLNTYGNFPIASISGQPYSCLVTMHPLGSYPPHPDYTLNQHRVSPCVGTTSPSACRTLRTW